MREHKKITRLSKILIGFVAVIVAILLAVLLYVNFLYGKMNVESPDMVIEQEETFEQEENAKSLTETKVEDITWNDSKTAKKSAEVVNILLAGEEAMHDDPGRGRTDSIMIVSLNKEDSVLRLTSIMRDTYVKIPGHSDNKINAAYGIGGMPLLLETIETNLDIKLDGYILIGFDGFEQLVDYLGGIDITLSSKEAQYLNTTDYIDNYYNKRLTAGTITLNGDQALGYARVRYVSHGALVGDFGRTKRHRDIMQAIFDKFREESLTHLLTVMPDLMTFVTTNLTRTTCVSFLTDFVSVAPNEIETFRVPIDGAYKMTRVNGMSVLLPDDLKTNIMALHQFVFGKTTLAKGKNNPNMMVQ
ncbi:MAG: LCP family protein [Velocimicrobium sp.]